MRSMPQGSPQRRLTEQDQLRKALLLDRAHPAFRESVQIWTARGKRQALHAPGLQCVSEQGAELLVSIVQNIAATSEMTPIFERSVPGYLLHPTFLGMIGHAADRHPSAAQMDEEQHVVRHQPSPGQHLDGEEVCSGQDAHVPPDEFAPGRGLTTLGRGSDTVATQDVADALVGNANPQVGQRSDNTIVTPTGILAREAKHAVLSLWADPRSAGSSTLIRAVELSRDQLTIPSEDRVGLGDASDLLKRFASQSLRCSSAALPDVLYHRKQQIAFCIISSRRQRRCR
jgi:hypothetical protein